MGEGMSNRKKRDSAKNLANTTPTATTNAATKSRAITTTWRRKEGDSAKNLVERKWGKKRNIRQQEENRAELQNGNKQQKGKAAIGLQGLQCIDSGGNN